MSRIHEALLKAQQQQGIYQGILDTENLPLSVSSDPTPFIKEDLSSPPAPVTADEAPAVAIAPDVLLSFPQHAWEPETEKLVFLKPEAACGIEGFRTLSSRLLRERTQRYLKTILITGATAEEGKTFIAANLALAMSRHPGNRVLLIDADLRRSSVHAIFGMEPVPGLSGYLSGLVEQAALVRQTPEPQLCIVPAGGYSSTPTELLHSRRLRQFIENMARCFDWIFIDSPPASVVSDSAVLSEISDAVVMVITPGTPLDVARKARKELGTKLLGVVLNRAEESTGGYNYYAYQERSKKLRDSKSPNTKRSFSS